MVVVAQEDGEGIERIRMHRVQDASAGSLHLFVVEAIEPGSVVHTGGWEGYSGVDQQGYLHEVTIRKRAAPGLTAWWPS
jgi:hypothetical protein